MCGNNSYIEIEGSSVVQWWHAGLLVNRLSDRSYTRGMIHNKIHLFSSGCPRPRIALQVQNGGLKHHSLVLK